jgi:hypothetical protein
VARGNSNQLLPALACRFEAKCGRYPGYQLGQASDAGLRQAGRHRPRASSAYDLNRYLPKGPTELKFNFIKTGDFAGTGELYVNGEKVDEAEMPRMHISTYSLAETFDFFNVFKPQANLRYLQ